jgi:hypothetical protein
VSYLDVPGVTETDPAYRDRIEPGLRELLTVGHPIVARAAADRAAGRWASG